MVIRVHKAPRQLLCNPVADEEDIPPDPINAIDVARRMRTNFWCGDTSDARALSDFWVGEMVFDQPRNPPPRFEIIWGAPDQEA